MAIGRPVVAFDSGGLGEQVIDGKTGFLVKRGDLTGFCEKVETLINDFHLAKKMGDEGRRQAEEKYDQKRMIEKYVAMLCNNSLK
jgi:glycosyltransferase involved in cell wall biosynthesis